MLAHRDMSCVAQIETLLCNTALGLVQYGVQVKASDQLQCNQRCAHASVTDPVVIAVAFQAVSDLSKFLSLCEEVIDLEHLQDTRKVRVRPSFHEELNRLGQELGRAREDMVGVLKDVEMEAKVQYGLECELSPAVQVCV